MNPNASLIKGVICGYRVEDIGDPLMQKIRYLDKLSWQKVKRWTRSCEAESEPGAVAPGLSVADRWYNFIKEKRYVGNY